MISPEQIVDLYEFRKREQGPLIERMRSARAHMNGDIVVPLPEMSRDEMPAVSNLIAQGLEQTAMRVASVIPNLYFPSVIVGKSKNEGSEEWARIRRMAVAGWWEANHIQRKLRRMSRWLIGYATTPLYVRPDFKNEIPTFELRNPLSAFPAPTADWDDQEPSDTIFLTTQTFKWLLDRYPEQMRAMYPSAHHRPSGDTIFELLEYVDADQITMIASASRTSEHSHLVGNLPTPVVLESVPNRAGVPLAVSCKKVAFDKLFGQFHHIYGMYQAQARLMALELISVEKGIFPDLALFGTTPGRAPVLVTGDWKDGRTGQMNIVKDGRVEAVALNPGFMGQPAQDRLERNMRTTSYIPAQFGGETPSNISTGRLGSQLLSATVDYPIQEYQELLADALTAANKRAIAVSKAWFGDQKKTFHVGLSNNQGRVDYKPNTHFETDEHKVVYAAPGADINSLVIGIGQRMGLGTMSAETAMFQDPLIPDPEGEARRVDSERIKRSIVEAVAGAIANREIHPLDAAYIAEEVEKGKPLAEALQEAEKRAQARQAEALAAQQEQAAQAGPLAEAQQGIGPPVAADEAGLPVQGPSNQQQNLSQMLGALRQPRPQTAPLGQSQPTNIPVG